MTLPKVDWTIDGEPINVADWSADCVIGGYSSMSGIISEKPARAFRSSIGQNSIVTGHTSYGVMWEGRMVTTPHLVDGVAEINAIGHKSRIENENERLLFQSRDYSQWQSGVDAPFNFTGTEEFDADARESSLFFKVNKEAYVALNGLSLAVWMPGANIKRYAFNIVRNRDAGNFNIRTQRFTGPAGSRTLLADHNLGAGGATTIDQTISSAEDGMTIAISCGTTTTPTALTVVRLNNLRLGDIATSDTFSANLVMGELAGRCGYENGIGGLGVNALPLDWTEDWASLADYAAMLSNGWWRVLNDRGNGPFFEANSWANSREWFVSQAQGAVLDLSPLELYNKVQVNYEGLNGAPRRVRVVANPNPLAVGNNVYEESLEDRQPDEVLATAVADYLLERYAVPRWSGTIELIDPRTPLIGDDPYSIRAGDKITVTDWDVAESFTHKVVAVEYEQDRISVSVEQDVSVERILANAELRKARKRKKRR